MQLKGLLDVKYQKLLEAGLMVIRRDHRIENGPLEVVVSDKGFEFMNDLLVTDKLDAFLTEADRIIAEKAAKDDKAAQ